MSFGVDCDIKLDMGRDKEFAELLAWHGQRYPLMQPADWGKLLYQSCLGPEHLLGAADEQWVYERLQKEWLAMGQNAQDTSWHSEPLGGGLRRLYLPGAAAFGESACRLLARLFCRTGEEFAPAAADVVAQRLELLRELPGIPGMQLWLAQWEQAGRPAPSHSPEYRQAYQPHYRLLLEDWAAAFGALAAVAGLLAAKAGKPCLVVIDGRCGGGKTSLAGQLGSFFGARVVHMDDYYLPMARRRPDWQSQPGGNLDRERFAAEVLQPLPYNGEICSRRFDCQSGRLEEGRILPPAVLTVIEGSYSRLLAPDGLTDLSIFVDCRQEEQERRLHAREGEYFAAFERLWLPLEERYFEQYAVAGRCDLRVVLGE